MFIREILNVLDTVHNIIKAAITGKHRNITLIHRIPQFSANTEDSAVRK